MLRYILGWILGLEGVLMIPSALISLANGEEAFWSFMISIGILALLAIPMILVKPKSKAFYSKEGLIVVAMSWIIMSLFGALPAYLSGSIPSFVDSFFETVSGFTTTGSTILTQIEGLPLGILFWRSFTHWIGGMGVLVFMLALVPLAGGYSMNIMRAESPGPTVGKLVPRMKQTAMILYAIYIALTALEIVLLLAGGMPVFDSFIHAFGTAGTGGFSNMNASVAAYDSAYFDAVITIFMILFGVNFSLYFLILAGSVKQALKSEELRVYIAIIVVSTLIITFNILPMYSNFGEALRYSSFQVASIITTTGFCTANFNLWPELSKCLLVLLMFIGAMAGSTGGGVKVSRIIIMWKSLKRQIIKLLHPRSVKLIRFEGKLVDDETSSGVFTFLLAFVVITFLSMLVLSIDNESFETTTTAVIACINNVGPGLDKVGAVGNFSEFSVLSKIVLSLDMIIGRLEIFPVLILFAPSSWKRI